MDHTHLTWLMTMSFSRRLTKIRKDKKLIQQQMADTIGIHVSQIKRYESAKLNLLWRSYVKSLLR